MPDPVWTNDYSMNQTPEQNGFTRRLYNSPSIQTVTGGNPAQRRIEIGSTGGDAVFELSNVPSLQLSNGATIEVLCSCTGAGDAGFELTFINTHFGIQVYQTAISVLVNDGQGEHIVATASNSADTRIRATVASDGTLNVYRNGSLIDTRTMPADVHALPSVLFWGEGGGTQIFRQMRFYLGGPVVPG